MHYKTKTMIDRILKYLNLRPIKTVKLTTGLYVDHYRNGKLIADKRETPYKRRS